MDRAAQSWFKSLIERTPPAAAPNKYSQPTLADAIARVEAEERKLERQLAAAAKREQNARASIGEVLPQGDDATVEDELALDDNAIATAYEVVSVHCRRMGRPAPVRMAQPPSTTSEEDAAIAAVAKEAAKRAQLAFG